MVLNFEDLEMQKWNIPSNKAEGADEKNGVICLVIKLTSGVMAIKMSKMVIFCIFCLWQQKISHSMGNRFKCSWKIFLNSSRQWY